MLKIYLSDINDNKFVKDPEYIPYVYAHGTLMDAAGYDIVYCTSRKRFNLRKDRIEDVIAILPDGEEIPATLYFWHNVLKNKAQKEAVRIDPACYCHGLVVAKNDTGAMRYAQKCYDEKYTFI